MTETDRSQALEVLATAKPFSELPPEERQRLAENCSLSFFPKGTAIFTQGVSEVDYLFIIRSGAVRLFLGDETGAESLADYRGEGACLGALGIIRGSKANLNAVTMEDTSLVRLPKADFLRLVEENPAVSRHFLTILSEGYVTRAFSEIRSRPRTGAESGMSVLTTRVEETINWEPLTLSPQAEAGQAAAVMARENAGSVLVGTSDDPCLGIVTDKDLRNKVLARGLGASTPLEKIMSSPVLAIEPERTCFDALLAMMRGRIHHLVVKSGNTVLGVITSHDLLELQSRSPVSLFTDIADRDDFDGLHQLARSIPNLAGTMIAQGARAWNAVRMISALNDLVLERVLTLLIREMGPPPVPFCWLLLGSEGRREQTLSTDQDNALVYREPENGGGEECAAWFADFGRRGVEHLALCGYRRCPGDVMASNPRWNRPIGEWAAMFDAWIRTPEPDEVLNSGIFFDFRAGFGEFALADELRDRVRRVAPREDVFLRQMAADCLRNRPPLSFFRNFIVEKDGEHKNTLDIKARGAAPLTDFARVGALGKGLAETGTFERLEALRSLEAVPPDLGRDSLEAFEFIMRIRLAHQAGQLEAGIEPDNRIDPAALSDMDKRTLKDAFAVIGAAQSHLKDAYRLGAQMVNLPYCEAHHERHQEHVPN